MNKIQFAAELIKIGEMDASFVNFPYNVRETFGSSGRIKVKALIDNVEYRGLLVNMGTGCHILGVTKEIRKKINKTYGDFVDVVMEKDEEERTVEIPKDLEEILNENVDLKAFFNSLSYTNRKEYVNWVTSAKKVETRTNRLSQIIDKLKNNKKNPSEK